MKVASVREFRARATTIMHGKEPVLVMRRGHLAGIFFPSPGESLPLEFKRELYSVLSARIARALEKRGVTEEEVLTEFDEWRKKRRAARRRQ